MLKLKKIHGFALLEALMAILLLSIGVLGLIALQGVAVRQTTNSADQTRAALLANDIISSLWQKSSGTTGVLTSLDSSAVLAWQSAVADATGRGLPGGSGAVSGPDANGLVTVEVTWTPPKLGTETTSQRRYTTKALIAQ